MITEEMLCAAAARSCEIYVSYLERGYTPENQHEFSLQFEKKIKKLKIFSILVDIYLKDMHWIETKAKSGSSCFLSRHEAHSINCACNPHYRRCMDCC